MAVICEICGKQFDTFRGLNGHRNAHIKRAESYKPPASAVKAAKKGLAQRKEWGRGGLSPSEAKSQGIDSGVTRARKIASGSVSRHDVRRMSAFNRHRQNNRPEKKMPDGGPTAGTIAWNLWGGTSGVNWAKKKSAAMNAETFDAERNTQWDKILAMINQYDMEGIEGSDYSYVPEGKHKTELPPFFNKELVDKNWPKNQENIVVIMDYCGDRVRSNGTYEGVIYVSPNISEEKVVKQINDWGIDTSNHKTWKNFGYFSNNEKSRQESPELKIYHFPIPNTSLCQWSNAYVRDTEYDDDGTAYTTFGQDCLKCSKQRRGSIDGDVSWDKNAEELSKTSCCCGADESDPCACMKAPEPMSCRAQEPKCACYKALEKNAEGAPTADEKCDLDYHLRCHDCRLCLDCNLEADAGGNVCRFCTGESIERFDAETLDYNSFTNDMETLLAKYSQLLLTYETEYQEGIMEVFMRFKPYNAYFDDVDFDAESQNDFDELFDSYDSLWAFIKEFSEMGNDYVSDKGAEYIKNHLTIYHAESFGPVDEDGQLAKALAAVREKSKRYAPTPLRLTKLPHPDQKTLKDFEADWRDLSRDSSGRWLPAGDDSTVSYDMTDMSWMTPSEYYQYVLEEPLDISDDIEDDTQTIEFQDRFVRYTAMTMSPQVIDALIEENELEIVSDLFADPAEAEGEIAFLKAVKRYQQFSEEYSAE